MVGEQIHDVVRDLQRQYINVEIGAEFKRSQYEGTRSLDTKRFSQCELDEFDMNDPNVVKVLLYTALLSLLVSRNLLDLVNEQADDEIVFLPERWAATFRSPAQLILHELGEYLGYFPPPLLERLIEGAQKIHKQRPILQELLPLHNRGVSPS